MIQRRFSLAMLFVWIPVLQAPVAHAESGDRGAWELVWSSSAVDGVESEFRDLLGEEPKFPFASRILRGLDDYSLAFFDADGEVVEAFELDADGDALVSRDGSCYVLWVEDPAGGSSSEFRFHRRGESEPDWVASAPGTPILMAPDGSFFIVGEKPDDADMLMGRGGRSNVQVVGAGGEIRGELPIQPAYSTLTFNGDRIVFLHDLELISLGRDGLVDWRRKIPIDNLSSRSGMTQLDTGPGLIVISGTGSHDTSWGSSALRAGRRGMVLAFDEEGVPLWTHEQPDESDLWFQLSVAVSPNADVVTSCHAESKGLVIRQYDASTGELIWDTTVRRQSGFRSLSLNSELTVLTQADMRTTLLAWDREGNLVVDGTIRRASRVTRVVEGNLLVADRWVARLSSDEPE